MLKKYSFKNFPQSISGENLDTYIRSQIESNVNFSSQKTFRSDPVDSYVLNFPFVYILSHISDKETGISLNKIYEFNLITEAESLILRHNSKVLYFDVLRKFNKIFVIYEDRNCCVYDANGKKEMGLIIAEGKVSLIQTSNISNCFYFSINGTIWTVDCDQIHIKAIPIIQQDLEIKSFCEIKDQNILMLLANSQICIWNKHTKLNTNFGSRFGEPIKRVKYFPQDEEILVEGEFFSLWKIEEIEPSHYIKLGNNCESYEDVEKEIFLKSNGMGPCEQICEPKWKKMKILNHNFIGPNSKTIDFRQIQRLEKLDPEKVLNLLYINKSFIYMLRDSENSQGNQSSIYVEKLNSSSILYEGEKIKSFQFCPDANWLVIQQEDFIFRALKISHNVETNNNSSIERICWILDKTGLFLYIGGKTLRKYELGSLNVIQSDEKLYGTNRSFSAIDIDSNNRFVLCAVNNKIQIKDQQSLEDINEIFVKNFSCDFLTNVKEVKKNRCIVWNENHKFIVIWKNYTNSQSTSTIEFQSEVMVVDFSEKHDLAVCGLDDGSLVTFNVEKLSEVSYVHGHKVQCSSLLVSEKLEILISASYEDLIMWSFPKMIVLKKISFQPLYITHMQLIKDKWILVYSLSHFITIYDYPDLTLVANLSKYYRLNENFSQKLIKKHSTTAVDTNRLKFRSGFWEEPIKSIVSETTNQLITMNCYEIKVQPFFMSCGREHIKHIRLNGSKLYFSNEDQCLYLKYETGKYYLYDPKTLTLKGFSQTKPKLKNSSLSILNFPSANTQNKKELSDKTITEFTRFYDSQIEENAGAISFIPEYGISFIKVERNEKLMIQVWDVEKKILIREYDEILKKANSGKIKSLKCDKTLRLYLTDGTTNIYYFDYRSGLEFKLLGCNNAAISKLFLIGSEMLISASTDKVIKFWNLRYNCPQKEIILNDWVCQFATKEDYNLLFICQFNGKLTIWDTVNLQKVGTINKLSSGLKIQSLAVSKANDSLYLVEEDKYGNQLLSKLSISSFFELSWCEKFFINEAVLGELTEKDFITLFNKYRLVYESSYLLKSYFNIHWVVAFKKYEKLLKQLVNEGEALSFSEFQITPIEYMMRRKNDQYLKIFLDTLIKKRCRILLDQPSSQLLLNEGSSFGGHNFLANNYSILKKFNDSDKNIEKERNFKNPVSIIKSVQNYFTNHAFKNIELGNQKTKKTIVVHNMNVVWDFDSFTEMSVNFLQMYSLSDSDEFILSPFCHIILFKWNSYFLFFIAQTWLYWTHVIFYFLYLIENDVSAYFILDCILLGMLAIYEIMNILAAKSNYFHDKWNLMDSFNIIICVVFLILNKSESVDFMDHVAYRIFMILSISTVSFRGFTFFKHYPQLSHITQMTIGMVKNSLGIVIIIVYSLLCSAVILAKSQSGVDNTFASAVQIYYNLLLGNPPSDFNERSSLYIIMVILASLLFPVFFMNFLIARLSSSYSDLEGRQKALMFKEMAVSLCELETIVKMCIGFFAKPLSKKLGNIYLAVDNEWIEKYDSKFNGFDRNEKVNQAHTKILKQLSSDLLVLNKQVNQLEANLKESLQSVKQPIEGTLNLQKYVTKEDFESFELKQFKQIQDISEDIKAMSRRFSSNS